MYVLGLVTFDCVKPDSQSKDAWSFTEVGVMHCCFNVWVSAMLVPFNALIPVLDCQLPKQRISFCNLSLFYFMFDRFSHMLHPFCETLLSRAFVLGINLAIAIALHNIPEVVTLSSFLEDFQWVLTVLLSLDSFKLASSPDTFFLSRWQAFKLATLSGFLSHWGIVVSYIFPSSSSPEILEGLLGSVGGVMAFLTLHEMRPLVFAYAGQKQSVKVVFLGMAFMSASLYFLEISLPRTMSSNHGSAIWYTIMLYISTPL
ncbi:LOW QUALITY PROTEIN: zinc transporter ZupT-like [Tripterygium wilfordii]|uniref:LOW QUALITY PROTEIN: zinc transporter ZupT-like n=1 Tax=Tripterygium wilfordii TaxID=458696 RepID=UPI0018F84775|nr:LOW QUALITY PROTEIN: zinc transporter ZupT-like [Tripterygium wilfordii]